MRPGHIFILLFALLGMRAFAEALPGFEWNGDIRYRLNKGHESIDEDRTLQQLRVRLGLKAPVNEEVHAILRLATATSAISGNQTLGDSKDPGMSRRGFGLDLAYMDWQFALPGNVWAGRTANPFWSPAKSQIIYDSDLAFEGVAARWQPQWSNSSVFINTAGYIISESYAAPEDIVDTALVAIEVGTTRKGETWSLTVHGAYHDFLNIQNKVISTLDKGADVDAYSYPFDSYRGNTIYPNDPLLPPASRRYYFQNKYRIAELGLEWTQRVGKFEYVVFADRVQNTAVGSLNRGLEYGVTLKLKPFWLSIADVMKERDAVVGAFTDSDTNMGGTDNIGRRIQLGASVSKNVQMLVTHFYGHRGVDTVERKFSLTLADVAVTF